MQRGWLSGLGLSLGLAVSNASAQEVQWHAARVAGPGSPPPAAVAPALGGGATAARPGSDAGPAVTFGAPVPLTPGQPTPPDAFRRVSFSSGDPDTPIVFRAQKNDAPKLLPPGPEGPDDPPAKKPSDGLPTPRLVPVAGPTCLGCDPCACDPCNRGNCDGAGAFCLNDCCGAPQHRFWISGEYLLWWMQGQRLPALVTTGPAPAVIDSTPGQITGSLGRSDTTVLFGNSTVGGDARSGGRLRAGWWFDDEHTIGIDGSIFALSQQSTNFSAFSPGSPALFRPFVNPGFQFNIDTGTFVPIPMTEDAEIVAYPGVVAGAVNVSLTSQLWGFDVNLRSNLLTGCFLGCGYSVDGYIGYRFLSLDEKLLIAENLTTADGGPPISFAVRDQFRTQNTFNGGQIGFETEFRHGRWFLDLNTKVAVGQVHQVVDIVGATAITDSTGAVTSYPGGLLAQPTNMGSHSRDRLAVVPETGLRLGYQVCESLRLFAGYDYLYVSSVVRPGAEIDRVVNPTQIPPFGPVTGPARPAFAFHSSDFHAQGISLGLEFRW